MAAVMPWARRTSAAWMPACWPSRANSTGASDRVACTCSIWETAWRKTWARDSAAEFCMTANPIRRWPMWTRCRTAVSMPVEASRTNCGSPECGALEIRTTGIPASARRGARRPASAPPSTMTPAIPRDTQASTGSRSSAAVMETAMWPRAKISRLSASATVP